MGIAAGNLYIVTGIVVTLEELIPFIKSNQKYQQLVGNTNDNNEEYIQDILNSHCGSNLYNMDKFLDEVDGYSLHVYTPPCCSSERYEWYVIGYDAINIVNLANVFEKKTNFNEFPYIPKYNNLVLTGLEHKKQEHIYMIEDCISGCS